MDIAHEGFWIPEFRTLEDEFIPVPDPSDTRRVNVLLGRNGSGKSSLLEALGHLIDGQVAAELWGRSAVAAYRVGAHFDGCETWRGNPHEQMQGLVESARDPDVWTVESYVHGDPLAAGSLMAQPEDLDDPAAEERQRFSELFGLSPSGEAASTEGDDQKHKPFTLEQWLVAVAALPPNQLEADVHLSSWRLRLASSWGHRTRQAGWNRRGLATEAEQWANHEASLNGASIQRAFFSEVQRWVDELTGALGQQEAVALVRNFLSRPLVLVGTATNARSAGFPAFFGLGLRRDDVDGDVADALDAFTPHPDEPPSSLVAGLVQAWKGNSPVIRITHPETGRSDPFDLAKVEQSPINWWVNHQWMHTTPLHEDPLGGGFEVDDEVLQRTWEVDLRPAALIPNIISATPQPGGLVEHLEERLPDLHDHIYFDHPLFRRSYTGDKGETGWAVRLGEAGYFEPMRFGATPSDNPKGESRRATANGWCVSGTTLDTSRTGDNPTQPDTTASLVVRGSVTSVARMISHRANQLAPAFLRLEGWIAVQVTPPDGWAEGKQRISVRLIRSVEADNRAEHATQLAHLSDGLARWVALVVRLAVTDLETNRWEVPVNMGHVVQADETIDTSNLPGDASQITPGEFTPSYGAPISDLHGGFFDEVSKSVGPWWFLLAAMQNPRLLREITDDQQQWKNTLLLVDEPEVHLHLDAQRSVRDWIGDIAAGDYRAIDQLWTEDIAGSTRSAIVASHSTIFLDYPPDTARTTFVYAETTVEPREPTSLEGFDETTDPEHDNIPVTDGTQKIRTVLTPVPEGEDIFQFFKGEQGKRLGTSGIDVIALYSGFIIVEGLHDELVLEHFYGTELKERRIGLLRAWGTRNAEAADLLTYIGKPAAILVDRAKLGGGEKAAVKAFVQSCVNRKLPHWPDHGQAGGHPYPDIIAALPDDAVRAAFPKSTFNGWNPIVDEFEQMQRQGITTGNFKDFATRKMGLDMPTKGFYPKFIKPVLKQCGDETRPREGLELVMNEIISFMANPKADIESNDFDDEPF